ncbi:MAG: CorA family divalent cation transporter [Candidatus Limnocylindrales bacterium]
MSDGVRARLFDADGHDREIDLAEQPLTDVGDRRLIWVDIDLAAGGTLDAVADALALDARDRQRIETDTATARLVQSVDRLHLTLESLEPEDPDDEAGPLVRREIDLLAGAGLVVTVRRGRVDALERFSDGLAEETSFGVLDAGDLLSSLVDEVITGYLRLAESIELGIDKLDQQALVGDPETDVLAGIVAARRRISLVRRTLAPHRSALAALARPEMRAESAVGLPWPGLVERLESALGQLESLRDGLLGTYDVHMGRVAQRANDVMKALTMLSAVLLPAVVLAGVMGMNFDVPFFEDSGNFYVVLAAMAGFAALLLVIARRRRWW